MTFVNRNGGLLYGGGGGVGSLLLLRGESEDGGMETGESGVFTAGVGTLMGPPPDGDGSKGWCE